MFYFRTSLQQSTAQFHTVLPQLLLVKRNDEWVATVLATCHKGSTELQIDDVLCIKVVTSYAASNA